MAKTTPPWAKTPQKTGKKTKMTPEMVEKARTRAQEAGRNYPNLIDNMAIIKESKR